MAKLPCCSMTSGSSLPVSAAIAPPVAIMPMAADSIAPLLRPHETIPSILAEWLIISALRGRPSAAVLYIADLFHPIDAFAVESLRDRDMTHGGGGGRPVPMLFADRNPDDVTRPNLTHARAEMAVWVLHCARRHRVHLWCGVLAASPQWLALTIPAARIDYRHRLEATIMFVPPCCSPSIRMLPLTSRILMPQSRWRDSHIRLAGGVAPAKLAKRERALVCHSAIGALAGADGAPPGLAEDCTA
jgi:hypothetical protein